MESEKYCNMVLGKLRGLRAERNYSLGQVGEGIGVGKDTLSLYENGKRKMPLIVAIKLLEFYNVEVDIFFTKIVDNSCIRRV